MRRIITICAALIMTASVFAQAPEKMNYQAVIRNNSNALLINQAVGMQISILQGSEDGTAVYIETHMPTTNANGLVSIEIGGGTVVSGTIHGIDWTDGPYFIQTETDPTGGINYTITGTSQLLSVPYALHSKTADTVKEGIPETDPIFGASVASSITGADMAKWNNKLDSYTETDPSIPTGTQTGDMQYWNGTSWVVLAATENEGATLQMIDGMPTWTGGTPPPPRVTNPLTGRVWMDRNLGASRVATSSTDSLAYGDLHQWGRGKDGHEIPTSDTTSILSNTDNPGHGNFIISTSNPTDWRNPQNDNLWQGVNGINNPCPNGYRLPTEAEWEAEVATWSTNNADGAFESPLKLPMAGLRPSLGGSVVQAGNQGRYWSSSAEGTSTRYMFFNFAATNFNPFQRALGLSCRCIKD